MGKSFQFFLDGPYRQIPFRLSNKTRQNKFDTTIRWVEGKGSNCLIVVLKINQLQFKSVKSMRFKDRLSKDKQLTDRPKFTKNTDSTPSLAKFEHHHHVLPQQAYLARRKDKENTHGMINSVPASQGDYLPHDAIKIDNYEGKRFRTQNNYEPTLVSSRYEGFGNAEKARNTLRMRQSQEQFRMPEQHHWNSKCSNAKKQQTQEMNKEGDRLLTFGLIKQSEPLRCSVEYREDKKIKNQVLDEIHQLRKSQEALLGSKQVSSNFTVEDSFKCVNHQTKKAKYRLITEENDDEESEKQAMLYCSKCAINLLQQGFRVEELKKDQLGMQQKRKSKNIGGQLRIQELKKLQESLTEIQNKLQMTIQQNQDTEHLEEFSKEKKQTELLYDIIIDTLKQMKIFELRKIQEKKQNRTNQLQNKKRLIIEQLQAISAMKQEITEYKNKFIIMKDQEFKQTVNSFLSRAQRFRPEHTISTFSECQTLSSKQKLSKIMENLTTNTKQRLAMDDSCYKKLQRIPSNEEFLCSERKKPFRTLFPEDDNLYEDRVCQSPQTPSSRFAHIMEVSEQNDSPSFRKMKKY